jgi:hypothetical protein
MSGPADIEACHERLHRAAWSIGEVGTSLGWLVTGTNGEDVTCEKRRHEWAPVRAR